MKDLLKLMLFLIIAVMLLGFVFSILFKIGIILCIILGAYYLYDWAFGSKY